ncbi:hypothetical protein C8J57DRAFT_1475969 [Mycena rebaudengoi]|nr:hypothetical protein C8J57DRAFT_1475969 [Mycena rebaudengoi]
MALSLTFNSENILDSHLYSGRPHAYTTTTYGNHGLETTKLMSGFPSPMAGEINWRDTSFEIGGRYKKLTPPQGSSSSPRYWTWGGDVYTVQYSSNKGWTANTPRGEVANYTRIVTPPQLAAIWISPEIVDQHEIVFLILVILYSETKRLETSEATPPAKKLADMAEWLPAAGEGAGGGDIFGGGDGAMVGAIMALILKALVVVAGATIIMVVIAGMGAFMAAMTVKIWDYLMPPQDLYAF